MNTEYQVTDNTTVSGWYTVGRTFDDIFYLDSNWPSKVLADQRAKCLNGHSLPIHTRDAHI